MTSLGLTLNTFGIYSALLVTIVVFIIASFDGGSRSQRTKSKPPVQRGTALDHARRIRGSDSRSSGWFSNLFGAASDHDGRPHSDPGSHSGYDSGSSGGDSSS